MVQSWTVWAEQTRALETHLVSTLKIIKAAKIIIIISSSSSIIKIIIIIIDDRAGLGVGDIKYVLSNVF